MTIASACTCTREDVQRALDVKSTARSAAQIDRIIADVTTSVEGLLRRKFYPTVATRKFDWPDLPTGGAYPWRVWLNQYELIQADTVTSGGVVIPPAGYLLEPVNDGPPYDRIEINLGSQYSFNSAASWQQSLSIAGTWGYDLTTAPAGTLAAALSNTTGTTVDLTDGAHLGVGSLVAVDAERMLVTGRQALTSGQTVQAPGVASSDAVTSVPVSDGTFFQVDEPILVDAERMLVVDIAGNTLVVKRHWDGTVLASHSAGATVYTIRRFTVVRGVFGTAAATHSLSAPVTVHVPPALVSSLSIAEAENRLMAEEAGYARTIGTGDNLRNMSMAGLNDLRDRVVARYGRSARLRTI